MADTANEGYLAVAKQTAQGTPAVPSTGILARSFGLRMNTTNVVGGVEIGAGLDTDRDNIIAGTFSVAGPVATDVRFDALGYLILAAGFVESGAPVNGTGADAGAYQHTFTPRPSNTPPTFLTIETAWGRNRAVRRFTDCLVNGLAFAVAGNAPVTLTADIVGLNEAWQTTPVVPTYATPDPKGSYLGSTLTLEGLGTYRFGDFALNLGNNIDTGRIVVGQRGLADLVPGARDVTLSGTIELTSATAAQTMDLYRAAAYGSKTATGPGTLDPYHTTAVATFGSGTPVVTGGTARYGVSFALPDVVLNAPALESSGGDVVRVPFDGRAFRGAAPVTTITLTNKRATAY